MTERKQPIDNKNRQNYVPLFLGDKHKHGLKMRHN